MSEDLTKQEKAIEKQKLEEFIEDHPDLVWHVRFSSQRRVMYEIMKLLENDE